MEIQDFGPGFDIIRLEPCKLCLEVIHRKAYVIEAEIAEVFDIGIQDAAVEGGATHKLMIYFGDFARPGSPCQIKNDHWLSLTTGLIFKRFLKS